MGTAHSRPCAFVRHTDGVWVIIYFLPTLEHGFAPLKACAEHFYGNGGNYQHIFKNVYAIDFNYKKCKVTVSMVQFVLNWRLPVRALISTPYGMQ